MADTLDESGESETALTMLRELQPRIEAVLGPNSLAAAKNRVRISNALYSLDRNEESLPEMLQALAVYESAHDGPHPDVMATAMNLGSSYEELGRFAEAEPQYQRAYDIALALWGADNQTTVTMEGSLGRVKLALGKAAEAEPLLVHMLGEADFSRPAHATNAVELARLFADQGRAAEAISLLDKAQPLIDAQPERFAKQAAEAAELRKRLAR